MLLHVLKIINQNKMASNVCVSNANNMEIGPVKCITYSLYIMVFSCTIYILHSET